MYTLRIEHPIADYERWKRVFDADPLGRRKMGVRQYRVFRAADHPANVLVDLEFDTAGEARRMLAELRTLWGRLGTGLVAGTTARLLEHGESSGTGPELSSIRDAAACARAADVVGRGRIAGTCIRGVCGLWGDGADTDVLDLFNSVKGAKREGRPAGTTLEGANFVAMIEPEGIAPAARDLFLDARRLTARLGSLCFIRIPIRKHIGERLPARIVSTRDDGATLIQNWIPGGCRAASEWTAALLKRGIGLPVATSMNLSGDPEITSQDAGLEFCRNHDVSVFLADLDGRRDVRGSFPIIEAGPAGVRVLREGHFPAAMFPFLLEGCPVDLGGCIPARNPVAVLAPELLAGALTGERLRSALIDRLDH